MKNVGVLMTDGRSNNQDLTWSEAMKVRDRGIELLAVGVGRAKRSELEGIVSYPTQNNIFMAENFRDIVNHKQRLVSSICNCTHFLIHLGLLYNMAHSP